MTFPWVSETIAHARQDNPQRRRPAPLRPGPLGVAHLPRPPARGHRSVPSPPLRSSSGPAARPLRSRAAAGRQERRLTLPSRRRTLTPKEPATLVQWERAWLPQAVPVLVFGGGLRCHVSARGTVALGSSGSDPAVASTTWSQASDGWHTKTSRCFQIGFLALT